MDAAFYVVLKLLVLPPGLIAAVGVLGLMLYWRWRRLGAATMALALLALALMSMPAVAAIAARQIEVYSPVTAGELKARGVEAIVVLGGGVYQRGPEFNFYDEVSPSTMERLRYAARLHRASGLDLAVTGGITGGNSVPEGVLMRTSLEADFNVPVRWAELSSHDTAENARFSRDLLPVKTIALVTHAVHMVRAVQVFEAVGFTVIPAPMGYLARGELRNSFRDFIPNMKALDATHYVLYELIGRLWYWLRPAP